MATRRARRLALAVLLVVAAGCGNDDDVEAEDPPEVEAPTEEVTPEPEPEPEDEPAEEPVTTETYTVESGDTLSGIAARFDTTVAAIVEINDIDDPDVLSVGQELEIPVDPGS